MCKPKKETMSSTNDDKTSSTNDNKGSTYTMPKMSLKNEIIACLSLGLLCGWYFIFILFIVPSLIYGCFCSFYVKVISGMFITILITLSFTKLKYKPYDALIQSSLFTIWREYFDYQVDISRISGKNAIDPNKKYLFAEFPHGSMPVAQIVSASVMDKIEKNKPICGLGADVIFVFPIMRQFMAALGVHPASRKNITKILNNHQNVAVIPGGIAEMYLINDKTEEIYLNERKGFIKAAIQEGCDIIPTFFFGNSTLFTIVGGSGSDTFLAKISRSLKASIMFFYGRFFLPIPYRKPLFMACGLPVQVTQNDNPTIEDINDVMQRIQDGVIQLYKESCPVWETRPLLIK